MKKCIKQIDVVILCGGKGTRLRPIVKDRPKPMAEINGKPFLDILITALYDGGLRRFILSTGYMGNAIKNYYIKRARFDIKICHESTRLGTGGGVRNCKKLVTSDPFLVINGDSFCEIAFREFLSFHRRKRAVASMVLVKNKTNADFGRVSMDRSGRVKSFQEKCEFNGNGLVNAGIYCFDKKIFSLFPEKKVFSLEYELFPEVLGRGVYGFYSKAAMVDIGTPKGMLSAKKWLPKTRARRK
jgi:NDP-sugar pyrophosphorylase family protein